MSSDNTARQATVARFVVVLCLGMGALGALYFLWVAYATTLNAAIVWLNR